MATTRITGTEVMLDEVEQAIVRHIAKRRFQSNRGEGVVNNRVGPQSDEATDVEGFGSEMACAKLFNVYPDFSIGARRGGHDCELMGLRIDAKGTQYRRGHLLAVIGKQPGDVDIYALMVGKFPNYYFAGCATASELLRPERITDLGHGDTYAMEQSDLQAYCFKHGLYPGEGNCPGCEKERLP